jgi:hypothetical protein
MTKSAHFARLQRAASSPLPSVRMRIALLTGQSRLDASPLSEAQRTFLSGVAAPGMEIASSGFPFDPSEAHVHGPPNLLTASLANARQFVWARSDDRYAELGARVLQRLLDSTQQVLVLIAGSCGLAIAAASAPLLKTPAGLRVGLLAFGPAGSAPPDVAFQAVQGRRDSWSRALYRGPAPALIDCGHMDYWESREARAIAAAFIASVVDASASHFGIAATSSQLRSYLRLTVHPVKSSAGAAKR